MQFRILAAASALLAVARGQELGSSAAAAVVDALPTSALAYISEQGLSAWASHVASQVVAGDPPEWFSELPPAVESQFLGATAAPSVSSGPLSSEVLPPASSSSGGIVGGGDASSSSGSGGGGGGGNQLEPTPDSNTDSSSAGAAMPTAVFGSGLIGAMGVVGLLAL